MLPAIALMFVVSQVWSCCCASVIAVVDAPAAASSPWILTAPAWTAAMTSGT